MCDGFVADGAHEKGREGLAGSSWTLKCMQKDARSDHLLIGPPPGRRRVERRVGRIFSLSVRLCACVVGRLPRASLSQPTPTDDTSDRHKNDTTRNWGEGERGSSRGWVRPSLPHLPSHRRDAVIRRQHLDRHPGGRPPTRCSTPPPIAPCANRWASTERTPLRASGNALSAQ